MSRSLVVHPLCVASRVLRQSSVHGASIKAIQPEPLPPRLQFVDSIFNCLPITGGEVLGHLVQEFLHAKRGLKPSLQKGGWSPRSPPVARPTFLRRGPDTCVRSQARIVV